MSEDLQRLLLAHFEGDEAAFRATAWKVVKRERRLNHHTLAGEIERILDEANAQPPNAKPAHVPALSNGNLPKDKDKNASLVEISDPDHDVSELVVSPSLAAGLARIVEERKSADLLYSHGVRPVSKVLFCGPPGCGKTMAAGVLAKELYLPLCTVRFDAVVSSYLGETAANLRRVFDFARLRPLVLFFDEFDAIGKHRTAFDEHGELKRVVNSFLQLLDGFHSDTLTIAATNHEGLLDPALWRRFDEILFFPKPTAEEIETLLCRRFRQMTVTKSVQLRAIARKLNGFAHADVERLAGDAIKDALLQDRKEIPPAVLNAAVKRQSERMRISYQASEQNAENNRPPKRRREPK